VSECRECKRLGEALDELERQRKDWHHVADERSAALNDVRAESERLAQELGETRLILETTEVHAGRFKARAEQAEAEVERLRALLSQAFDAGMARAIASHEGFVQIHPSKEEWLADALAAKPPEKEAKP